MYRRRNSILEVAARLHGRAARSRPFTLVTGDLERIAKLWVFAVLSGSKARTEEQESRSGSGSECARAGAESCHDSAMRSARPRRRLCDSSRFPGFRPLQTVVGIFGKPGARVVALVRRSLFFVANPLDRLPVVPVRAAGVAFRTRIPAIEVVADVTDQVGIEYRDRSGRFAKSPRSGSPADRWAANTCLGTARPSISSAGQASAVVITRAMRSPSAP